MTTKQHKPINEVLAENIAAAMERKGILSQTELAKRSGLAQTTISNYLHPENRLPGKSGKPPSAKLSEVERIAAALDVESWNLLRPISPREQKLYERIEAAYRALTNGESGPDA